jgi:hypothetical protein
MTTLSAPKSRKEQSNTYRKRFATAARKHDDPTGKEHGPN